MAFDETFSSVIAETWRPFRDSLSLLLEASFIPATSSINDVFPQFEKGQDEVIVQTAGFQDLDNDVIHSDLITDIDDEDIDETPMSSIDSSRPDHEGEGNPQVVDDGMSNL